MTLLTTFALASLLAPQTPDRPQLAFEVASIRLSTPQPFSAKLTPGRLVIAGATLSDLIEEAYGVSPLQVSGVFSRSRYTMEAKAAGTPARSELMAMLRTLLAERFKLELHREMREMQVTALVLRKNAWKGTAAAAEDGDPKLGVSPGRENGNTRLVYLSGESVTLPFIAKYVSARLNRMVVDETGLAGAFDFKVDLLIDAERAADRSVPERQVAEEIVTDLVARLGLRLEQRREMVDVIVVDHSEPLEAN